MNPLSLARGISNGLLVLVLAMAGPLCAFHLASSIGAAIHGPAEGPLSEDGDARFRDRPRSEFPPVSEAAGLASTTTVTGNGKD